MNIKILCSCGTKFSFDVEPVDGKMPSEIFCPKCGADGTDYANQIIQQSLSPAATTAAAPAIQKPRVRLNVVSHAAPVAPSGGEAGDGMPVTEMCSRHPRNIASEHCVVCKKPICMECMQIFGYLCSIGCKYRADQEKIVVPKYKFQKNAVEKAAVRKSIAIVSAVLLFLFSIIGAWFWYAMVGTKPRPFYSLNVADKNVAFTKFLGPNEILLIGQKQISLHDIKSKKDVWSTALDDPKPAPETKSPSGNRNVARKISDDFDPDDFEDFSSSSHFGSEPFFKGDDVWLCLSHNVVGVNLKTGEIKHRIPVRGRLSAFTPGESTLLVVSEKERHKKIVMQINMDSGEVKTEEATSSLREKVRVSDDLPSNVLPTAALLLQRELEAGEKNRVSLYKFSTEFFPAGQNLVEMQVKMVEPKPVAVQTIKPAGPSRLNQETRASSDVGSLAEEIFNDLKRSSGGGFKWLDESRYAVLLRRTLEKEATDWSGEVVGLPVFFSQKSVDLLVAGKKLMVFDKQNKKTGEAQLSYPIADFYSSGYGGERAPCVETNGVLYFFDQGHLTAFGLPTAEVRWRFPSVGISEIQFDEKGMLYLSTTTGSPEDIQYSEQIKMNDAPQPILVKVDPNTGKMLWKCDQTAENFFLTGKFVYITDASRGEFSMISAVKDAFGADTDEPSGNARIVRVNPSSGKRMWAFQKNGVPDSIDFSENRILFQYGNQVQVMKFLTF